MNYFKFEHIDEIPVGTFYCVGKNYAAHAKEMGGEVPEEPMIFIKPSSSYLPDGSVFQYPSFSNDVHYEVELVVILGDDCYNVSPDDAMNYIAGYAVGIDFTLRDKQVIAKKNGTPWTIAKAFRQSAVVSRPIEISHAGNFPFVFSLFKNNELVQTGVTSDMIFSIPQIISYLSNIFDLKKGDAIFTGTPAGVGPVISGDKLRAEIEGIVELNIEIK